MPFNSSRIALVVLLTIIPCVAQQDTASHRRLERARMGTSALQMRLELLQRLQQIAKDRQKRGQPPLDLKRLPKGIRDQIEKAQQQDKALRDKIDEAQKNQKPQSPEMPGQSSNPDERVERNDRPRSSNPRTGRNDSAQDSRRIAPGDSESMKKALEQLEKLQGRRSRQPGDRSSQGNQSNRVDPTDRDRRAPGIDGTPSERPLSPNEGFDISKYLERLGGKGSGEASKSGSKRAALRSRNGQGPSGSQKSPLSNKNGSKPNLKKLWKQATQAGKSAARKSSGGTQQPRRSDRSTTKPPMSSGNSRDNTTLPDVSLPKPGSQGEGVFGDALRRTLDGSAEYIGDLAKGYRKPSSGTRTRNGGGVLRDMSRKTGDLFGGTSRPRIGGGGGMSMPNAPSPTSLLPFVIGLAVLGIAWFFMRTLGDRAPAPVLVGSIPATVPPQIDSRQDVIDAFHYIASESPAVKGNWWTHSRAARALRKLMPQKDDAVSQLTRVYETARYLPPNETLTQQQLQTAREAIERCVP